MLLFIVSICGLLMGIYLIINTKDMDPGLALGFYVIGGVTVFLSAIRIIEILLCFIGIV